MHSVCFQIKLPCGPCRTCGWSQWVSMYCNGREGRLVVVWGWNLVVGDAFHWFRARFGRFSRPKHLSTILHSDLLRVAKLCLSAGARCLELESLFLFGTVTWSRLGSCTRWLRVGSAAGTSTSISSDIFMEANNEIRYETLLVKALYLEIYMCRHWLVMVDESPAYFVAPTSPQRQMNVMLIEMRALP